MKKKFPVIAMFLCATVFAVGVVYLFLLRFEVGDVYPPYSSLRADPLGTMALCESLEKIPGLTVRRDFSESNHLPEEHNTTYLHLAAEVYEWRFMPTNMFKEIEAFAERGGRLVVTMYPETGWRAVMQGLTVTNSAGTNLPGFKGSRTARKGSSRMNRDSPEDESQLEKRWGVSFAYARLKQGDNDAYEPAEVFNATDLPLAATLDWHSALVFTNLDKSWHTIYARGKSPVVVERKFGRGSVVMATDSYFLSNEAMWKSRHPELLAWLIGAGQHVYFDEAHLGVTESSGVAVLMRKYRLHGVIAGLVLLAGLFIWKNSVSLVPPHVDVATLGFVTGKDSGAGFVNLLRRNISSRDILNVCFEEWSKSLLHRANYRISAVDQAQAVMEKERATPSRERDSVKAYQEICRALKSRESRAPKSAIPNPQSEIKAEITS